jgi:uncharacterized membrane protein YhaH (DUF805 family)
MNLRDLLESIKLELCHLVFGIIYFVRLKSFNNYLLSNYQEDDYFKMILENTNEVLIFLLFAVIMIIIGISVIGKNLHEIRNYSLEIEDILFKMVGIVIEAILIILTIVFIYNPILRGILLLISLLKVLTTA